MSIGGAGRICVYFRGLCLATGLLLGVLGYCGEKWAGIGCWVWVLVDGEIGYKLIW